jgi:hypothetical protein
MWYVLPNVLPLAECFRTQQHIHGSYRKFSATILQFCISTKNKIDKKKYSITRFKRTVPILCTGQYVFLSLSKGTELPVRK